MNTQSPLDEVEARSLFNLFLKMVSGLEDDGFPNNAIEVSTESPNYMLKVRLEKNKEAKKR